MKTKRLKLTGIILCLGVIIFCVGCLFKANVAHASPTDQRQLFLPTSEFENTNLNAIVETNYNNGSYGIVQEGEVLLSTPSNSLTLTVGNELVHADKVAFFNDGHAVILDDGKLKLVNLTTGDISELRYNDSTLACTSFDLSDNYLVVILGENNNGLIKKYSVSGHTLSEPLSFEGPQTDKPISGKKPVTLNSQNVYFVILDKIYYKPLNDFASTPIPLATASPSKMIANDEHLFFIEMDGIYKIDLATGEKTLLSVDTGLYENYDKFDLGNFTTPSSISFKGENLLVSDKTLDAVQEFKINGDKLEFTGFAIAKGKTAYNRISINAEKIERNGEYLVVKDGDRLTVIKNTEGFDGKNTTYFKNFFDLGFQDFCVGNGKILLTYSNNTVKLLDIESGTLSDAINIQNGAILDVSYANGGFYLATNLSTTSYVYNVSIDGNLLEKVQTFNTSIRYYVQDQANNQYIIDEVGKLYKNNLEMVLCEDVLGTTEIQVDLDGTIYLLQNNKIVVLKDGALETAHSEDIKSFTLSFDEKEVYFLKNNDEFIYTTASMDNHSIDGIQIPNEYKLTDSNAYVENLTLCSVNADAGVYSVGDDKSTFTFNGVTEKENQYLFICDIQVGNATLCALAGQNGIVLTYKQFTQKTVACFYDFPTETYVTTGVHVYYLPIITEDNKFVLTDGEELIRLEKGTKIIPIKAFSAIDRDYYYAEITINEKTYKGYVPKEFTVDVLAEDKTYTSFSLGKVKQTKVYLEQELSTEITTLEDKTSVRIIVAENGVAEIYFQSGEVWLKGYVEETALYSEKNNSIRNAVMILIAVTCACSTIIYFMFRKKS